MSPHAHHAQPQRLNSLGGPPIILPVLAAEKRATARRALASQTRSRLSRMTTLVRGDDGQIHSEPCESHVSFGQHGYAHDGRATSGECQPKIHESCHDRHFRCKLV
jgi:hypothetical protein